MAALLNRPKLLVYWSDMKCYCNASSRASRLTDGQTKKQLLPELGSSY